MTEAIWISDLLAAPDLVILFETDIVANDVERAIEAVKRLKAGKPVPEDTCPKQIWGGETAESFEHMPNLFIANGYCIVSEKAADVLRRFDLGEGALYAVEAVYQKDRTTRIPGNFFCWIFGNTKEAFLGEESQGIRQFGPVRTGRWTMPFVHHDDQLAMSRTAIAGPDVWTDPRLFKSVFVSGRLGDALIKAGLRKTFGLFRCRVIDA